MSPDYSTFSENQLRYALATKVMGWKLFNYEDDAYGKEDEWERDASKNDGWHWEGDMDREAWQWDPTRDWNHTMEVVIALNRTTFQLEIPAMAGLKCCASFKEGNFSWHGDPQRAICLAALLACD